MNIDSPPLIGRSAAAAGETALIYQSAAAGSESPLIGQSAAAAGESSLIGQFAVAGSSESALISCSAAATSPSLAAAADSGMYAVGNWAAGANAAAVGNWAAGANAAAVGNWAPLANAAAAAASANNAPSKMTTAVTDERKCHEGGLVLEQVQQVQQVKYSVTFSLKVEDFLTFVSNNDPRAKKSFTWCVPEKQIKFVTSIEKAYGRVHILTTNKTYRRCGMILTIIDQNIKLLGKKGEVLQLQNYESGNLSKSYSPQFENHTRYFYGDTKVRSLAYEEGWCYWLQQTDMEDEPSKYLQEQSLVVSVYFEIIEVIPEVIETGLTEDIRAKWSEGKALTNTDVSIICQGQELRCHKFVLGSRSEVFASYFKEENGTLENKTNTVTIEDADPDVVQEFIKFIYTNDELKQGFDNICQLIYLADKYNVTGLKLRCEKHLIKMISTENVAKLAVLGKSYNADKLKDSAIQYIINNKKNALASEGWNIMMKEDPRNMSEILMEAFAQT